MLETATAAMGGDGQRPAVLNLRWWPVVAAEGMTTAGAASMMAEAAAVMEVGSGDGGGAATVEVRRLSGLRGKAGSARHQSKRDGADDLEIGRERSA